MENKVFAFDQKINASGNIEFRCSFGRKKQLYDNRQGKSDKISLGLDELDFLVNARESLEQLKGYYPQVSTLTQETNYAPSSTSAPCTTMTTSQTLAAMGSPMQILDLPMHESPPCLPMAAMGAPMQVLHLQQTQEVVNYISNCQTPILPESTSMFTPAQVRGYKHIATPFKRSRTSGSAADDQVRGKRLRFTEQYETISPPPVLYEDCENIPPEMFTPYDSPY
ncbi:Hypothetical predicted protein [Mytilus galloprovincialis]|uniref:Uncharacterized protein n=1 Tax=Mytilus galloprovincialis TaxID=29158 RepID=A0A8B6C6W1_MYTGA|nr:Hypothetical predicted protein [Mytilus galloprovincialis]